MQTLHYFMVKGQAQNTEDKRKSLSAASATSKFLKNRTGMIINNVSWPYTDTVCINAWQYDGNRVCEETPNILISELCRSFTVITTLKISMSKLP